MSLENFPAHLYDNAVIVNRSNAVVTIMINRPKAMNTMDGGVIGGVLQALEMCADDSSVAVVVFTGVGDRAFCAGGNLQGGGASAGFRGEAGKNKPPPTSAGAWRSLRMTMATSQVLRNSHFISIAAVNGACAGAGLSWACACDLRVASETALFRSGFLTAGLSGDFGGLAAAPPLALKRIKANLVDSDRLTFEEHLDIEAERHARCGYHPDAAEAGEAFLSKRKAKFVGLSNTREQWEMSKL
eukprot:gene1606-7_t